MYMDEGGHTHGNEGDGRGDHVNRCEGDIWIRVMGREIKN